MVVAVIGAVLVIARCEASVKADRREYVAEHCGHLTDNTEFMACRSRILAEKGWTDDTIPKPRTTVIYNNP